MYQCNLSSTTRQSTVLLVSWRKFPRRVRWQWEQQGFQEPDCRCLPKNLPVGILHWSCRPWAVQCGRPCMEGEDEEEERSRVWEQEEKGFGSSCWWLQPLMLTNTEPCYWSAIKVYLRKCLVGEKTDGGGVSHKRVSYHVYIYMYNKENALFSQKQRERFFLCI